ncbi:MAG: hypothetical protein ABL927_03050 [Bdellovibrionales bacterium]
MGGNYTLIAGYRALSRCVVDKYFEFYRDSRLQKSEVVAYTLWECLVENDIEAFKEILRSHLEVTNKNKLAKSAGISRRTLFRMLSPEGKIL